MGGKAMVNAVQQLGLENYQSFNTQQPYVNKTINTTINPYPSIGQLFPNLNTNLPQPQFTGAMEGAGRFRNLLDAPINYSAPSNVVQNNYESTYKPAAWEPSPIYKMGSLLSSSDNPIFSFIGNDMMSSSPKGSYTFTPTTNTQGK
jgi:hypothetical protein